MTQEHGDRTPTSLSAVDAIEGLLASATAIGDELRAIAVALDAPAAREVLDMTSRRVFGMQDTLRDLLLHAG